jgi:hypothetical protein
MRMCESLCGSICKSKWCLCDAHCLRDAHSKRSRRKRRFAYVMRIAYMMHMLVFSCQKALGFRLDASGFRVYCFGFGLT